MFAMASTGMKTTTLGLPAQGVQALTILGGVYHLFGSLLPDPQAEPAWAQLYVYDGDEALRHRLGRAPADANGAVARELQRILHANNPFVHQFVSAVELARRSGHPLSNITIAIRADTGSMSSD